ncbi:MAG: MFS transporter [Armatimonadetes bacterium]|nr:MFS transporter [Armatimonadota bacterium]
MNCSGAEVIVVAADQRREYFWYNLACTIVSEGLWGFGSGCLGLTTVLVAFVSHLGASNMAVGLMPAAFVVGWTALRIPGALLFRPMRARKVAFAVGHIPPLMLQFAMALVAARLGASNPRGALTWFFILAVVQSLMYGALWSVWPHLLDRMFPPPSRGRAVGVMSAAMSAMAMVGGLYAHAVLNLDRANPPFHILFWVTGLVNTVGLIPWFIIYEAPLAQTPPPVRVLPLLRQLFRSGSPWRGLVGARWACEFSRAPLVFATVLVMDRFGLPAAVTGTLTFLMNLGSGAVAPLMGSIGDRFGHKTTMVVSGFALPFGTLLVSLAPHPWVAFVGFFIIGAVPTGDFMGAMNLVIEAAPEEDKAVYSAIVETCMFPPRLLGPVLAGAVAQATSAATALGLAVALQVLSLLVTVAWVVEPRNSQTTHSGGI